MNSIDPLYILAIIKIVLLVITAVFVSSVIRYISKALELIPKVAIRDCGRTTEVSVRFPTKAGQYILRLKKKGH